MFTNKWSLNTHTLDNSSTHSSELKSGNTVVKFLSGIITSLIQPMGQGVLESFRRHYRGFFLRYILEEFETHNKNISDTLK